MRSLFGLLFATATAMVGYHIHHSLFWAVVDFIFSPVAIIKWLICHELTLAVIKDTFSFFTA